MFQFLSQPIVILNNMCGPSEFEIMRADCEILHLNNPQIHFTALLVMQIWQVDFPGRA